MKKLIRNTSERQAPKDMKKVSPSTNPYESVGVTHNEGLRTIIQRVMPKASGPKKATKKLLEDTMIKWLTDYAVKKKLSKVETDEQIGKARKMFVSKWWPLPKFPGPYWPYPIGDEAFAIAKEVVTNPQQMTLDAYQVKLLTLEKRALAKKDNPFFHLVLLEIAIARQSANFWAIEYPKLTDAPQSKQYVWLQGATVDALGGCFGLLPGALGASAVDWYYQWTGK